MSREVWTINKIILIGTPEYDPKPYLIRDGVWHCEFVMMVARSSPEPGWTYNYDYIPCVAHRHHAEFLRDRKNGDELQVEGVLELGRGQVARVIVDNIRRLDRPDMCRIICSQDLTDHEVEDGF